MAIFRTFLLRGGRFAGCRLTCQKSNRPGTVILFEKVPSKICDDTETGELYEYYRGEYVLGSEEDDDDGLRSNDSQT